MNHTETTQKSSPAVATEILNQLGGRRFVAMTGSKNFVYDNTSLTMRLARNKAGAQYLNIKLNGLDLYNLKFSKVNKNYDLVIVAEYENIYFEDLQSLFTEVTGLYTSF